MDIPESPERAVPGEELREPHGRLVLGLVDEPEPEGLERIGERAADGFEVALDLRDGRGDAVGLVALRAAVQFYRAEAGRLSQGASSEKSAQRL